MNPPTWTHLHLSPITVPVSNSLKSTRETSIFPRDHNDSFAKEFFSKTWNQLTPLPSPLMLSVTIAFGNNTIYFVHLSDHKVAVRI